MHTKCPECILKFTTEELHDASLEDHLEYKRITNDLIKNLRAENYDLRLGRDSWRKEAEANEEWAVELKAQNARYREALEYYANRMGMGGTARKALKGER